ncbi:MAG: Anti-sigma F factor [Candidatus Argoarchaeum ethanivorans]|uniref:Anti-sigma F factor n=1 Tax=Candidatus Argoarchaeum ethanivorans TaxID=2608793 RepID=A0A811TEG7_9EURY|nr:MAG: Anti-sigma F factor [Candidatus Argoarchaeum ethanivorans]
MSETEKRISIKSSADIITARGVGREMAKQLGFNIVDQTKITTAISELTRNIVTYTGKGRVIIKKIHSDVDKKDGMAIICTDKGPGIESIELVLKAGYSTSNSLGLGLSGAKMLMDDFDIKSKPGQGTRVTIKKWLR